MVNGRESAGGARQAPPKKRIVTGVAISPTEVCAADIRLRGSADHAWRAALEPAPAEGVAWPSLIVALNNLAEAVGGPGGTLAISLLPPLTEVRRLELPPLDDIELQRLLARNASRYFVNARGAQVVGSASAGRRVRGAPAPVVATSASARQVAMIRTAAQQAGWTIESVAPAESAWAAGMLTMWPASARQPAWGIVAQLDRTDVMQFEGGRLVGVRRFRAGAADAARIVDAIGPSARVGIVGAAAPRRELAGAMSGRGITGTPVTGGWSAPAELPELLAAHFAGREIGPVLRGEETLAVERARGRRAAWLVAAAAVVVLALSAAVELWGVHRQLVAVRAERERIRPQIASTLIGRTTVDAASRNLALLNAVERDAPRWSSIITTLSQAITEDTYLTAIRARKDSIVVDGLAEHASRVFDALQRSNVVVDVKAAAPVRRELQDDGTALDHFTIAARVPPPKAPSVSAPAPGKVASRAGGAPR
jgi:Tfp pilus assembly protein PilN